MMIKILKSSTITLCASILLNQQALSSIDPQTRAFLDEYCTQEINLADIPLEAFRADEILFEPEKSIPVFNVYDITINGSYGPFAVRVYHPEESAEALPVLLFLHGGGWVWGGLNSHDAFCRELCMKAKVIVVAVDYHQAPENKFPAAIIDCYTAACWVANNADQFGVIFLKLALWAIVQAVILQQHCA